MVEDIITFFGLVVEPTVEQELKYLLQVHVGDRTQQDNRMVHTIMEESQWITKVEEKHIIICHHIIRWYT